MMVYPSFIATALDHFYSFFFKKPWSFMRYDLLQLPQMNEESAIKPSFCTFSFF